MKTKLISFTQPCVDGVDNVQELIAYCARVSNPSNQLNKETSSKLLQYLMKNKHWSPFEMANACIEIETTRDIGRQILRHRSFVFQEFSQRYSNPLESFGFEKRECRLQDEKNRQNSVEITPFDGDMAMDLKDEWNYKQDQIISLSNENYKWAIDNNIAKEQARAILPEGLTKSRLYMSGSIRSWITYIALRMGNGTQKEHREVALGCLKELETILPDLKEFVNYV